MKLLVTVRASIFFILFTGRVHLSFYMHCLMSWRLSTTSSIQGYVDSQLD